MKGGMMERPLSIPSILAHAAEVHGRAKVVSSRVEGDIHALTYAELAERVARLANALLRLGVRQGERVATLAWNGHRHLELYHAVPAIGAVCHTVNPRLAPAQMAEIITHASDRLLFADTTFAALLPEVLAAVSNPPAVVFLADETHMPAGDALCYEALLAAEPGQFDAPELPENTASGLCYTSGTTGSPKGALYSHRSTVLHAFMSIAALPSTFQPGRVIMPAVPLFHVNAWGTPFSAPLAGTDLVLPGPNLDGASLFDLMDAYGVTSAWGVPTVWLGLLGEMDARNRVPAGLTEMVIGGSAAPRAMIDRFEDHGVAVTHAWGMTELSPLGTVNVPPAHLEGAERRAHQERQGQRMFGLDFKIVDDEGARQPHDGTAVGELYVRGNAVIAEYYNNPEATAAAIDAEGWFGTGDVATISPEGVLTITDRAKDLIKSGGEWISSIDLENAAMLHPAVAQCAVIAVPHDRWGERPLLVVVPKSGQAPERDALLAHLSARFARWQLPDDVVSVDALPLTATGKISKLALRKQFAGQRARAGV